jgi:hypothetical protein
MLEELAWTQQLPALAHLLGRDDVPRKEHHLPRSATIIANAEQESFRVWL